MYDTNFFVQQKQVFNFIWSSLALASLFTYKEALIAVRRLSTQIIDIFTKVDLCSYLCKALHLWFVCVYICVIVY